MAPPTKHDDDKKNPSAASPSPARRTKVLHLSCRANPSRAGGVERPAVVVRHLGSDQIRSELLSRYYRRSRRRRLHACFLEVLKLTMAARRRASSSDSMSRVPGSTEDGLAAMMAQLTTTTTTTTTTPAGGERATTTVPASATSPAADQSSSGLGEMFEKMVVSSEE